MTDARFEKLVNLYLDKEITPGELSDLKAEIAHNLVRRQSFERLCKVHSASRKALIGNSASSGINKFLREQVATVETRSGKGSRVRRAGTKDEVEEKAKTVLLRGVFGFVAVIVIAGLLTAYLIDRTAYTLQTQQGNDQEAERSLDMGSLQGYLGTMNRAERFILANLPNQRGESISQIFVLRWETDGHLPIGMDQATHTGQWTLLEVTTNHSPTETYILQKQWSGCAGQLPGTSAPAAIPPPLSTPLLLTDRDFSVQDSR